MDIKARITNTFRQNKWNYYSDDLMKEINIDNANDCREFIRRFFSVSGKSGELNSIEEIVLLSDERCQHIVYVFLLGASVYEENSSIRSLVDQQVQNYKVKYGCTSDVNFYFIWFLCCLFHDLGYVKEDSKVLVDRIDFQKGQTPVGVPKVYSRKTIESYWRYRQQNQNSNDHGIYAGIVMYQLLCRIRGAQEKDSWKNEKLSWEKELEHIYNVASWIVLCHNIWFAREDETYKCQEYKPFNLDSLILGKGEYKININKHPLFFFFCLIDTIEPIKKVKDLSLLSHIDISFSENELIITSNLKCGCGDAYLKSICGLNDWLIETKRDDNRITIII